jgi:3,4-dihydroxy 2-butanone 4-phosphate synthase/GTP cyclohydrolase II
VLVRSGHTEAACDIARLAGLYPSGVICEIMNDDGSMARLPDLVPFAQLHGLKIGTIADLIAYRLRYDNLVKMVTEKQITSVHGGEFTMKIFANTVDYAEHVALVKGDISGDDPVLVRMHTVDFLNDVIGLGPGKDWLIQNAMKTIEEEGRGVIVLLRDTSATSLTDRFEVSQLDDPHPAEKRLVEYGIGAQILNQLGVAEMILLSNTPTRRIVGLDGYGLRIVDQRPIHDSRANTQ